MTRIDAYIAFNGSCRAAMEFYKECFGGELTLLPVAGSPAEEHCPPEMKDQVLHASLINAGLVLMGSDMVGPAGYVKGNSVTLSVNCSSDDEINSFFSKLSEGGEVTDPLGVKFWGATFGMLNDKFGIRWMLNYDKNQA